MANDALLFNGPSASGSYYGFPGPAIPAGDWCLGFWFRPTVMASCVDAFQYVLSFGTFGAQGSFNLFIPSTQGGSGSMWLRYWPDANWSKGSELNNNGCTRVLPSNGDTTDYLFVVQFRGGVHEYWIVAEGETTITAPQGTNPYVVGGGSYSAKTWRIGGRTDGAARWVHNAIGEMFFLTNDHLTAWDIAQLASGKHIDAVRPDRAVDLRFRSETGAPATVANLGTSGGVATRYGTNFSSVNEFWPNSNAQPASGSRLRNPGYPNFNSDISANRSLTLSKPQGTRQNDVLIAMIDTDTTVAMNSYLTSSGWTLLNSQVWGTDSQAQTVFWKVAGASEPTSYDFACSLSGQTVQAAGAIYAYTNASTTATPTVTSIGAVAGTEGTNSITLPPHSGRVNTSVIFFVSADTNFSQSDVVVTNTGSTTHSKWTDYYSGNWNRFAIFNRDVSVSYPSSTVTFSRAAGGNISLNGFRIVLQADSVLVPVRGMTIINGKKQVVSSAQLGTGLKPLVLYQGALKLRSASEGTPVVVKSGRLWTLSATETLQI